MNNPCTLRLNIFVPALLVSYLISGLAHSATADISDTTDYLAISVEAEDYETAPFVGENTRWVLTDPTTEQTLQDPDGNNSSGAVGEKYVELLPDVRVTHEDTFGPPAAFWGAPGAGPQLEYNIDFPEAGRYYVHIRSNSSGTEDNGIHVGLNDTWPDSGARIQSCAAGQGWAWTSRQRYSGGAGACGTAFTVWLDVPQTGINTVKFSAREDGFELDRFVLIKDKSQNTRVCQPTNEGQINCRNGSIEVADDFTDVAVRLDVDRTAGVQQDLFVFNAEISNDDRFDNADQVIMESTLNLMDVWEFVNASDSCTLSGQLLSCSLGNLPPTAPDEDLNIEFSLRALEEGEQTVSVEVTTTSVDETPDNNSSSIDVSVEPLIEYVTIESTISRDILTPTVVDEIRLTVSLQNASDAAAQNTTVSFMAPAGMQFGESDLRCTEESVDRLICSIETLEANATQDVSVHVLADTAALYPVTIDVASDNLAEGSFSTIYTVEVIDVEETQTEEMDPDTGDGRDKPESEEPGTVTQTSGGGSAHWQLLFMLLATFGLRASFGENRKACWCEFRNRRE